MGYAVAPGNELRAANRKKLLGAKAHDVKPGPVTVGSVPIGLYRVRPARDLTVTTFVVAYPPEPLATWLAQRRYLPRGVPLLKPILALEGQMVCRAGPVITIDGRKRGDACGQDQSGRPLPVWQGCRVIGEGELFLMNPDEPASLDGCYFGPIPIAAIAGRAEPMWTSAEDRPCIFDASPMPVSGPCRARSDHAASGRECRGLPLVSVILKVNTMDLTTLITACALTVDPKIMHALIWHQSGGKPWAFSVSGQRQPQVLRNMEGAIGAARGIQPENIAIRVGLAGLPGTPRAVTATTFIPCSNIASAARQIAQFAELCRTSSRSKGDPIHFCRADIGMPKPQRHLPDIACRLEHDHCTAMSKLVRRDGSTSKGRTNSGGSRNMLVKHVLEARPRHRSSLSVHEQLRRPRFTAHAQPCSNVACCLLPDRQATLLAALAANHHAWRSVERNIFQQDADQLGDAQAAGEAELHHRPVPHSQPRRQIGRVQDRAYFP